MKNIIRRDHLITGIIIGLVSTAVLYFGMGLLIDRLSRVPSWMAHPRAPFLIALIPDVFLFRYFMVNKKQDKTGRGILLVVFAVALLVFFLIK